MRYSRQNKILDIITNNEIETQEKLAQMLKESGFEVTQATISRDIRELQLVKILTPEGKYKYAVSASQDMPVTNRFIQIFRGTVRSVASSGNIIVQMKNNSPDCFVLFKQPAECNRHFRVLDFLLWGIHSRKRNKVQLSPVFALQLHQSCIGK